MSLGAHIGLYVCLGLDKLLVRYTLPRSHRIRGAVAVGALLIAGVTDHEVDRGALIDLWQRSRHVVGCSDADAHEQGMSCARLCLHMLLGGAGDTAEAAGWNHRNMAGRGGSSALRLVPTTGSEARLKREVARHTVPL